MEFDRPTKQFLIWPLAVSACCWLVALAFYEPRSLVSLGAFGASAICGLASGSALPHAVGRLVQVPATRVPSNFLLVIAGLVPLSFVVLAAVIGLVTLAGT